MSNPTGKGGFGERKHHINRKGKPKSFDALRQLAQTIAHEDISDGMTVTEAILRKWAGSKDPRLQMAFIEYAFGKPPQQTENKTQLTGADGGPIKHEDVGITDEERARRLTVILNAARDRRDRQPVGDGPGDLASIAGATD